MLIEKKASYRYNTGSFSLDMKKFIAGIILSLFFTFSLVQPAFAQATPVVAPASGTQPDNCPEGDTSSACQQSVGGVLLSPDDIIQAINAPTPNLANTTAYVFYTISVLINGTFDPNPEKLDEGATSSAPSNQLNAYYPKDVNEALAQNGAVGGVGFMISELISNKPASAGTYVADIMQNSRFGVQPAYAQGIGFAALTPILGTWKAFRDMAYYLLTVMFLITGILILIRHKISSNMAVTVQNALPRLVITLIMITFSYAIAGAIVDLMFLVLNFIVNVFQNQIFEAGDINSTIGDARNLALNTHIFSFTMDYVFGSPGSHNSNAWEASRAVGQIVYEAIKNAAGLSGAFESGGFLANLFTGILQLIFAIIFGIALLIAMFRVFFALVMSYAGFVMNVVLSPLILLEGAIPGKDPFKDWIKNLIAGLAPFVVVVFMILMSLALTGSHTRAGIGYDQAAPADSGLRLPLILAGNIPAESFLGILGMGFMLLLPNAVEISKKIVGAKGGIMDEYKDKALGNFKQGWKGPGPVTGKGIVQGAGRFAAGAAIGGGVGAAVGYNQRRAAGGNRIQAVFSGAKGGAAGGAAGGAILGALPIYNKGAKMYEKAKGYGNIIDSTTLAANQFLLTRRAERDQKDSSKNLDPKPANPTTGTVTDDADKTGGI
jgi:hypothetical protein